MAACSKMQREVLGAGARGDITKLPFAKAMINHQRNDSQVGKCYKHVVMVSTTVVQVLQCLSV